MYAEKGDTRQYIMIGGSVTTGLDESAHIDWEDSRRELIQVEAWENEMLCNKARFARSKYFRGDDLCDRIHVSPLWRAIKSHHSTLINNSRPIIGWVIVS